MAIDASMGSFLQKNSAIKLKNAIPFTGLKNSLISFKSEVLEKKVDHSQLVNWGSDDTLGQIKFSNDKNTYTFTNIKGGLVDEIETSPNEIKMFSLNKQLKAIIMLEKGFDPNLLEIGMQNQKNFGLNIRYNGQSYILYDMGADNPSYAKLDGKFSVEINPPAKKQVAFRGSQNIAAQTELSEQKLSETVAKVRVGMLAGGFGSRLLANSGEGTKPTVEYGLTSFVNRVIHLAKEQGFQHFGASLYNKPEFTKAHIIDGNPNIPIVFATQNNHTGNLGTAGAVRHLVESMIGTELSEGLRYVKDLEGVTQVLDQFLGNDSNVIRLKRNIKEHLSLSENFEAELKSLLTSNHTLRKEIFEARMDFARDEYPGFLILSGDHCTNIDLRNFVKKHVETNAQLTVALQPISHTNLDEMKAQNAKQCQLGVACIPDPTNMKISEFKEKPVWKSTGNPKELVFNQNTDCWANTGIYIFSPDQILNIDSADTIIQRRSKEHLGDKAEMCDIGKHIIPGIVEEMNKYPDNANHLQGYSIADTHWQSKANSNLIDKDYTGLLGHISSGEALWADLGTPQSLLGHLHTLTADIKGNNGKSTLIEHGPEGFDTEFIFNAAVSRHASYNTPDITSNDPNATLVVMDGARIHPNTIVAGNVYIGKNQDVPSGQYRNVWVNAQPNSLFTKPLNVVA